jgi:hypothetical protein
LTYLPSLSSVLRPVYDLDFSAFLLTSNLRQRDLSAPRRRARRWATEAERQVDRRQTPTKFRIARLRTFGELIDLHIGDICDAGKSPRRSRAA